VIASASLGFCTETRHSNHLTNYLAGVYVIIIVTAILVNFSRHLVLYTSCLQCFNIAWIMLQYFSERVSSLQKTEWMLICLKQVGTNGLHQTCNCTIFEILFRPGFRSHHHINAKKQQMWSSSCGNQTISWGLFLSLTWVKCSILNGNNKPINLCSLLS